MHAKANVSGQKEFLTPYTNRKQFFSTQVDDTSFIRPSVHKSTRRTHDEQSRPLYSEVITTQPSVSDKPVHDHGCLGEPKEVYQNPACCVLAVPAALIANPIIGIGGIAVGGVCLTPHIAAACPTLGYAGATTLGVTGGMALPCAVAAAGTYFGRGEFVELCLCSCLAGP